MPVPVIEILALGKEYPCPLPLLTIRVKVTGVVTVVPLELVVTLLPVPMISA